jgi:hypothetical protein
MQTRTLGLRGIALALAGVLTLGLTACDETDVVTPVTPSTIQVSPAGPLDLQVGNTVTLVTNVTNPAPGGAQPTYASSNPAVATVSGAGVVTAVSAGTATITVTAQGQQGALQQGVLVRVTAPPVTPPPPTGPTPTVIIQSLQTAQGEAVNTADVRGQIFVRLQVERGNADSLQVRLGNQVVCRQSFVTGTTSDPVANAAEFVCPINTAQLNADGTARFPNAATTVSAHLFRGGSIVASASQPITLNNPAAAAIGVTADTTAIGQDGFLWHRGALTVTISPATFAPGQTLGTATIILTDRRTDTQIVSRQVTASPFQTTFAVTGAAAVAALASLTTDSLEIRVVTTTGAGAAGPTATRVIRYDNVAPDAFTLAHSTGFVGAGFMFTAGTGATALTTVPADPMPGSGNVTVRFFAVANTTANAGLTATQIVNTGTQVTSADALAETAAGHRIAAAAYDAVGNRRVSDNVIVVRVDRAAPSVGTITGIRNLQICNIENPCPTQFTVDPTDEGAGFTGNFVLVRATITTPAGTTCAAGYGTVAGNNCTIATTQVVDFPTADGYYNFQIRVRDQAGNVSTTTELTVLRDDTTGENWPRVESINFPVNLTGGATTTFTGRVRDDVDLGYYQLLFNFTGFAELPQQELQTIDATFGAPLTNDVTISTDAPFVRGVRVPTNQVMGGTTGGTTAYTNQQVGFRVQDFAGNVATSRTGVPSPTMGTVVQVDSFYITTPTATTLNADNPTRTISARAVRPLEIGGTPTGNPFVRVHFYAATEGTQEWRLIGTSTAPTTITQVDRRTFTWTTTLDQRQHLQLDGNISIMAIGVEADGDALATPVNGAYTITR